MIKVMAFGSFDLFHRGHEEYLLQARSFGDCLVVVVSRDSSYERIKKEKPLHSEEQRLEVIAQKEYVDKAMLGDKKDFYKVIHDEKPDILCLGYDQRISEDTIYEELERRGIKNIEIKRAKSHKAEVYKSSLLKKSVNAKK
ncbi:MAG: FAD synthase [Nanoarchaeota archaeon]|nr:FAD synthase [Nanoarchaeota archaeon]MBU1270305.1 FAD synthase [Nanoarchaeota archaeon]MBU1604527.1 FAD synthase [Nanoarchaeota archaeon]MBU2442862.1 FAD synthase [Nanoarchaeota archaeon]